jgi:polysaccharide deacetylase 2 family uncharacterized protein YibQ
MDRPERGPSLWRGKVVRIVAAGLSVLILACVALTFWFGDPQGGLPRVRVPITTAQAPAAPTPAPAPPPAASTEARVAPPSPATPNSRSAGEVETASGVSVVRPTGTSAPTSVIVRVPDKSDGALSPAPDERLSEKSRYGVLPKIGPDGARAAQIYARPVGTLPGGAKPVGRVAIVVGGLGISERSTDAAIKKLPPAITLAFAPYGADVATLAAQSRAAGHEIMLQVPMEPFDYPDSDPGPHTLTVAAKPADNLEHLRWAMGRMTGFIGIQNYMGAKLTSDANALPPVLREITSRGLVVLDDGSSSRSRVTALASDGNAARADAVIDAVPRAAEIDKAFEALEATATSRGLAIGTASALPLSIERIEAWARKLESKGILLVPVSAAYAAERKIGTERTSP